MVLTEEAGLSVLQWPAASQGALDVSEHAVKASDYLFPDKCLEAQRGEVTGHVRTGAWVFQSLTCSFPQLFTLSM